MIEEKVNNYMRCNLKRTDLIGYELLCKTLVLMLKDKSKNKNISLRGYTIKKIAKRLDVDYGIYNRNLFTLIDKDKEIIADTPKQLILYYYYRIGDKNE